MIDDKHNSSHCYFRTDAMEVPCSLVKTCPEFVDVMEQRRVDALSPFAKGGPRGISKCSIDPRNQIPPSPPLHPQGVRRWVPALRATLLLPKPVLSLSKWWGIILATYVFTTLSFSSTASADNLGRLFFTPEQRAQIDFAYARNATTNGNASPVLTVNGIVQKHGGARTVWINGVPQSVNNRSERSPTTEIVAVPGKSKSVKLKVGDKILLDQAAPAAQGTSGE